VIECADVVLRLADRGPHHLKADYVIADIGLTKPGETGEEIPFLQLGVEKFGRDLFGNMIALGRLLCVCDVDFTDEHLTQALPKKYIEDNIAAIKYGYAMDQESIKAIVSEQAASSFAARYAEKVLAGVAPAEAVEQAAARIDRSQMSPRRRGRGHGPRPAAAPVAASPGAPESPLSDAMATAEIAVAAPRNEPRQTSAGPAPRLSGSDGAPRRDPPSPRWQPKPLLKPLLRPCPVARSRLQPNQPARSPRCGDSSRAALMCRSMNFAAAS